MKKNIKKAAEYIIDSYLRIFLLSLAISAPIFYLWSGWVLHDYSFLQQSDRGLISLYVVCNIPVSLATSIPLIRLLYYIENQY